MSGDDVQQQQQQQRPASTPPSPPERSAKCTLHELVQYHCELIQGGSSIRCQPIERIFKRCPGRPAVEVTHVVEADRMDNVYLPSHMRDAMPPAKHWHELSS